VRRMDSEVEVSIANRVGSRKEANRRARGFAGATGRCGHAKPGHGGGRGNGGRGVQRRTFAPRGPTRGAKVALDVLLAAVLLLLLTPLMALIALCVVAESPGPVFYRARRVGRHGRPLRMLKFRKMAADARGGALTVAGDPRLTRVGALLVRTRLDELPQLLHVLRGEMSLVGPRPEDPDFVARYPEEFAEILTVRPGMTGLSQLAFTAECDVLVASDPVQGYVGSILPQKIGLDRLYVSGWSLRMDLRILLWTFAAVVLCRPVAVDRANGGLRVRRRNRRLEPEPGPRTFELPPAVQDVA